MVNTIIMAYFTYNVHLKANENRSMSCMTYALHFTSLRIYIEEHTHDMHTKWTLKITKKNNNNNNFEKKKSIECRAHATEFRIQLQFKNQQMQT